MAACIPLTNQENLNNAIIALGKAQTAYSISKGDRRVEFQRLQDLMAVVKFWQEMVGNDANPGDGGIVLARFGDS